MAEAGLELYETFEDQDDGPFEPRGERESKLDAQAFYNWVVRPDGSTDPGAPLSPERRDAAYARLVVKRDCCWICGGRPRTKRRLLVDHCHKSGEIRGLLCSRCNSGIGFFKDDPQTLVAAIEYLIGAKR